MCIVYRPLFVARRMCTMVHTRSFIVHRIIFGVNTTGSLVHELSFLVHNKFFIVWYIDRVFYSGRNQST